MRITQNLLLLAIRRNRHGQIFPSPCGNAFCSGPQTMATIPTPTSQNDVDFGDPGERRRVILETRGSEEEL